MRTCLILSVLTLFTLAAFAADDDKKQPPDGWKEVAGGYKKHAYTIWLPANGKIVEDQDSIVNKGKQIRFYRTVCKSKNAPLFAVGQILLPPEITKMPMKDRYILMRDMFLDEVNGKLTDEKKVTLGTLPGKEFTADTPDGIARYRIYPSGVQFFRALAVGSKKQMESKDVDMFFDSFTRTQNQGSGSGSDSGSVPK